MRQHAGRFGVDSQRLGITGSSAGGLLALIAAFHGRAGDPASEDPVERASSVVQAVGSFFAPTDLLNYGAESRHIIDLMQTRGAGIDPSFQF